MAIATLARGDHAFQARSLVGDAATMPHVEQWLLLETTYCVSLFCPVARYILLGQLLTRSNLCSIAPFSVKLGSSRLTTFENMPNDEPRMHFGSIEPSKMGEEYKNSCRRG